MKLIQMILAAFAALVLSSCTTSQGGAVHIDMLGNRVILGNPNAGNYGQQQYYAEGGHSGPPGARPEPKLVDGGKGYYSKSKWQNGVDRHSYKPNAGISTFNQALTAAEKFDLANKIDAWAIEQVKAKKPAPTDQEATAEARRIVGHEMVRVKMGNEFSNQHIEQERKLVSREKVDAEDVPEPSRSGLKSLAEEQFYKNQTNEIVKDGKFYSN